MICQSEWFSMFAVFDHATDLSKSVYYIKSWLKAVPSTASQNLLEGQKKWSTEKDTRISNKHNYNCK